MDFDFISKIIQFKFHRRSDTPVFMQEFLSELLLMVLTDKPQEDILERITQFRMEFSERPGWEKGSPKRANKIGHYQRLEQKQGKANMPGHVRASINWNTLKRMNGDKYSQEIVDGMKVIVCKLKQNPLGYTSVAYPTDELRMPDWFKELPFDDSAMAETIIDNKLDNLIGVLNYPLEDTKRHNTFSSLFDFGDQTKMKIDVNISIDTSDAADLQTIEEIIEMLKQLAEKMR